MKIVKRIYGVGAFGGELIFIKMNGVIRIGIIGAGANTRLRHIPGFQAIDGVEVAVVCNRSRESSLRAAKEFHIPRIAGSWEEVASDHELDAVCIGTWPYLHADITIMALEYDKHVLTEARMARNVAESEAMLRASRTKPDRVAQIVPSPFSLNYDATVRDIIRSDQLGEIYEICATHTGGQLALKETPLSWRQNFHLSGLNMLTLGIFHESVERWIDGEPEWVVAGGSVFTPERVDAETGQGASVQIPDSISVFGQYATGARMVYHFSGVESGKPRMEIRVNGSKGSLRLDFPEDALYLSKAGSTEEKPVSITAEDQSGWQVEAEFIDSIRNGTPVARTDFDQGLRYMRFTEAVYNSWSNTSAKVEIKQES